MDRFGIFVDAGYLFAASGLLCRGTGNRNLLVLDAAGIARGLTETGTDNCGLPHLRTYWYDGARDARPTAQHVGIAHLPGVKLRLGRLVSGRQKGVDSRIVRDLIILSQERAISVAYLLGGDEDLREGVREAQERGVRVVLMAIEPLNVQNLSPTLAMEADEIIVLHQDFVGPFISLRVPSEEVTEAPRSMESEIDPRAVGREYAVEWLVGASPTEKDKLRNGRPRIPSELDRELLTHAGKALRRRHLEQEQARAIRSGFWEAVLADITPEDSA